jgi:hypothetical protein
VSTASFRRAPPISIVLYCARAAIRRESPLLFAVHGGCPLQCAIFVRHNIAHVGADDENAFDGNLQINESQSVIDGPAALGHAQNPDRNTFSAPMRNERSRARKRKWSSTEGTLLLLEAKAHRLHTKRFGGIVEAHAAIAVALNGSRRFPWLTDRRHVASRLAHLIETRRTEGGGPTIFAGEDDESGEMENLLDDLLEEADLFKKAEDERRAIAREHDDALVAAGAEVRSQAMRRQFAAYDSDNGDDSVTPVRENSTKNEDDDGIINNDLDATGRAQLPTPRSGRASGTERASDLETSILTHIRDNAARQRELEESRMKIFADIEEKRILSQQIVDMARMKFKEELEMRRLDAEVQHRASSISLEKQKLEQQATQNQLLLRALEALTGFRGTKERYKEGNNVHRS